MAARLGVATHKLDRLVAVAAVVEDSEPEDALSGLSLIEAVAEGWWYAARIPGNRYMLTLMTDSDQLTKSDLRQPQQFLAAWQATEQLQHWVPPPKNALEQKNVSAPAIFPAPTRYLSQACGAGWIAAGDALIGMDPLTAAGIDGALDDALAAAETILRWLSATSGADCMEAAHTYSHRAEESLRRYLMERRIMYRREQRWRDRLFWQRRHDGHTKTHL
jgi:flavin-dependent dehydrogenase